MNSSIFDFSTLLMVVCAKELAVVKKIAIVKIKFFMLIGFDLDYCTIGCLL